MTMQEVMERANNAKSPEELLAMAKEMGVALTAEEAEEAYGMLHKKGELSDEELDNVAGGGCNTSVNGQKYTVVTSGQLCFTGKYENNWNGQDYYDKENMGLRVTWAMCSCENACGSCRWLQFEGGIGYCSVS